MAEVQRVRPFRFAVSTRGHDILSTARRAEELGYSTLCLPDHFSDQAAPMVALAAAAAVTTRLRLGPLVCANDFRHPAVLAKEVATLDALSQGRVQFGLGAGWLVPDYQKSGIPMDSPGLRIERLAEAVQVIRGLFGPEPFSFGGRHYTIADLQGYPRPVQQPLPLYLGGGGRRMLTLAAREAQVVGIGLDLRRNEMCHIDFSAGACDRKLGWVRQEAGARFAELDLSLLLHEVCLTEEPEAAYRQLAESMETELEVVRQSPVVLVGSFSEVVEQLQQRRRRWGINEWVVREAHLDLFAPVVAQLSGR